MQARLSVIRKMLLSEHVIHLHQHAITPSKDYQFVNIFPV